MKILEVTPRYPPQPGGVEIHVKEISERLVEHGHEVTVITADAGKEGERRERRNGVSVRRYRSLAPNGAMHFCPQITPAVRKSNEDVIHAHNYHSFPLLFAAAGIGDRRFVVTTHYHGRSADSTRDRLLSLYRPFGRRAVRRADEVIAVSEWEQKQLESDLEVDATVIPNGVDVDRFAEAEPLEQDQPYLLTVGRLEEYKGVHHVIRAMSELSGYDLFVAGNGPYREELEQIAHVEGVQSQVKFLGYVSDDELPGLYAGASVYVTMSEFEAYGITVAEALAAGTSCVVRGVGALIEWADQPGCISVKSVDPSTIASAVERARGQRPGNTPALSWDKVVDRLLDAYKGQLEEADKI
jgi:glycosyltransferase involved in cell wall biosynthesis